MSSCLILQQEDEVFIGADSIICNLIDKTPIRTEYEDEKIFIVGKDVIFCSGSMDAIRDVINWCKNTYENSSVNVKELSKKLSKEYPYSGDRFWDIEVVISSFINGKSVIYQLSPYKNYVPVIFDGSPLGVMIITAGVHTEDVFNFAANAIRDKLPVQDIFKSIYTGNIYENMGGQPTLIKHNTDSASYLIRPKKLNRANNKKDTFNYIGAEFLLGKLIMAEKMVIQNQNNTITMNQNGIKASATNGFAVQINPDVPDDIFTISENGTKLMYIDAVNRKLVFKGRIEANEGLIGNWTIGATALTSGGVGMSSSTATNAVSFWAGNTAPTSAPFRVLNNGKLYATDADVSGTITALYGKIGGWTIDGNSLVGTNVSYIMGGRINIGNGFFGVSESEIYMGDFYVTYTDRALFMSTDQYSGMSASTASNRFALWGGYNGGGYTEISNYVFAASGDMVYAKELTITGDSYWQNWTLTRTVEWLDDRIAALGG